MVELEDEKQSCGQFQQLLQRRLLDGKSSIPSRVITVLGEELVFQYERLCRSTLESMFSENGESGLKSLAVRKSIKTQITVVISSVTVKPA